jgi:hypothetical protein
LPEVKTTFSNAELIFNLLNFKPFADFMSALAEGQGASGALSSVSTPVKNPMRQSLVLNSVIYPLILQPLFELGLLVDNPFRSTGLWDEVIRIS